MATWNIFEIKDERRTDTGTPVEGENGWYAETCSDDGTRDVCGPYDTEEEAQEYCDNQD